MEKKKGISIINNYECVLEQYQNIKDEWTRIPNNTFEVLGNQPYAFLIYCYLCKNFNNEKGYAFPSKKYMAEQLRLNKRTIDKNIKYLEDVGLILIIKRKNKEGVCYNTYYIKYIKSISNSILTTECNGEIDENEQRKLDEFLNSNTTTIEVEGIMEEYEEDEYDDMSITHDEYIKQQQEMKEFEQWQSEQYAKKG